MSKVYLITCAYGTCEGDCGEYNVRIYADETEAELVTLELNELLESYHKIGEKLGYGHEDLNKIASKIKEIDTSAYLRQSDSYCVQEFKVF